MGYAPGLRPRSRAVEVMGSLGRGARPARGRDNRVRGAGSYSTLVVAAFAFAAWQQGISRIGANKVLVYQYLIVLTGVISGVVLLSERLGANKLLGGAVILVGVY